MDAKTPEQLEKKMLSLQVKSGKSINFSIPTFNNDMWHTWFLYDYEKQVSSKQKLTNMRINNGDV